MFAEIALVDAIERPEVTRIVQPHTATHDMLDAVACFVQNSDHVLDGLVSLFDDAAGNDFTIFHGHLTGNVQPAIGLDRACKRKCLSTCAGFFSAISFDAHWMGLANYFRYSLTSDHRKRIFARDFWSS